MLNFLGANCVWNFLVLYLTMVGCFYICIELLLHFQNIEQFIMAIDCTGSPRYMRSFKSGILRVCNRSFLGTYHPMLIFLCANLVHATLLFSMSQITSETCIHILSWQSCMSCDCKHNPHCGAPPSLNI